MENISPLIDKAVDQLSSLPGIGRKTAMRLVLDLLRRNELELDSFSDAFRNLSQVQYCETCHNISDSKICTICAHPKRDKSVLCVVEDIRDVIAIEATQQYFGSYHVLGGIISPMDGIGPNDLNIGTLINKVEQNEIREIILALSATMEGDTTNFYLSKKLTPYNAKLSIIARGVAVGDNLEYADEVTLGRSILNRLPYENTFTKQ